MLKKILLLSLFVFALGAGNVFATGDRVADKAIKKLDELAATPASGDWMVVSDVSADKEKRIDADRISFKDPSTNDVAHAGDVTVAGELTTGAGTKSAGWAVADSAETTTNNSISGTLTTFALPGSSTCYIIADVIGRAGTGTARLANKITGTFDRVGAASMTLVGTDTLGTDSSAALEAGWQARWEVDDGSTNEVQLRVSGTNARVQWIGHVRSIVVTTTGAE